MSARITAGGTSAGELVDVVEATGADEPVEVARAQAPHAVFEPVDRARRERAAHELPEVACARAGP